MLSQLCSSSRIRDDSCILAASSCVMAFTLDRILNSSHIHFIFSEIKIPVWLPGNSTVPNTKHFSSHVNVRKWTESEI